MSPHKNHTKDVFNQSEQDISDCGFVIFSFIVIIFTMRIFVGVISCVCLVPGLSDCLSLIRLTFAAVCVLALFACLYFSDLVSALVE